MPRLRVHLTLYHGVFAPHSALRAQITPGGWGTRKPPTEYRSSAEKHRAMSRAQRLKRVFKLDIESGEGCGGQVRVIACIEDPPVTAGSAGPGRHPVSTLIPRTPRKEGPLFGLYSALPVVAEPRAET